MMSILQPILDVVRSFRICTLLRPDQRGVRLFAGKVVDGQLGPGGLHWCWPVLGEIDTVTSAVQVVDVAEQSLTTSDGVSVAVGVKLSIRVADPVRALYGVWDIDHAVRTEATGFVAAAITDRTWENCLSEYEEIQDEITHALRKPLADWGVRVHEVKITDLCRSKCLRLIGDSLFQGEDD